MTRGEELWAELQTLRAARKASKLRAVTRLQRYAREADGIRAEAERILAGLPREPVAVTAARAAVLDGLAPDAAAAIAQADTTWNSDAPIRALATMLLAALPTDPDAARHRQQLLAALGDTDITEAAA